jgi:hypothetical protein
LTNTVRASLLGALQRLYNGRISFPAVIMFDKSPDTGLHRIAAIAKNDARYSVEGDEI